MPAANGRPSWASRIRFGAQVFALVLLHASLMPGTDADLNAQDACPPRYRRGSPDLPAAKAAKKAEMRQRGFPERLISLIDRLECVACVETAPDAFSILVVYKEEFAPRTADGRAIRAHTHGWNPQSEMLYREELAAGRIEKFYIMNAGTRCECCPDIYDDSKTQGDYDDWNDDLDIHEDIMDKFDDPSDLGPLPEDLQNPPSEWIDEVPPLREFTRPTWRVVQALCPNCVELANGINAANRQLDSLWTRKITLMERINIIQRATAERGNAIARLRYRQLYAATKSPAQAKELESLEQINEAQSSDLRRAIDELEGVDAQIAALNAEVAKLTQALRACEERCKTDTATAGSLDQPTGQPSTPTEPSPTEPTNTATGKPADAPVTGGTPTGGPPRTTTTGTTPGGPTNPKPSPPPGTPPSTSGGTPPTGQVPSGTPPQTAPALCPDCEAAAAEVARIAAQIEERTAEQNRLRDAQAANDVNISNLALMRADAAARNETARVADYEQRIADLQAANRDLRRQQFEAQEAIEQLNEALAKVMREVEACNSRCAEKTNVLPGGIPGTTGTAGDPRRPRGVAVGPLTAKAACSLCEPLASELRAAHGVLVELAERANATLRDDHLEEFEEQRVRVAALERQLADCNRTCTTSATPDPPVTSGETPTATGGTPPNTTGGTPPPTTDTTPAGPTLTKPSPPGAPPVPPTGTPPTTTTGTTPPEPTRTEPAKPPDSDTPPAGDPGGLNLTSSRPTTPVPPVTDYLDPTTYTGCYGAECASQWQDCLSAGTCPDVDLDCGISNNCPSACPPGETCSSVGGPPDSSWFPCQGCDLDSAYQLKIVVTYQDGPQKTYQVDRNGNLVIPPTPQQGAREWFNPLGLLARTVRGMVDRWRGSLGPRPLLNLEELKALEPYTGGQALGLPKGVHMLLMDRGGSTGKTLSLQVLNLSGRPFRLSGNSFAIEPIKREAQQRVQQAFSRVAKAAPINVDLAGYCLEMLKLPPGPNTLMRVAPAAVQKRFQQMSRVLKSAYRVQTAGVLNPDSEPGAYADSIKQWAIWSVEQRFNQSAFTDAFVQHTRKNVEAAKRPWQRSLEDVVRNAAPNRWQDIVKVLHGAGLEPAR